MELDKTAHTMEVTYTLDPGPVQHFGPLAVTGLERLDPEYVEGRFAGSAGEVYNEAKVEETRRALIASGLFSTVRIRSGGRPRKSRRGADGNPCLRSDCTARWGSAWPTIRARVRRPKFFGQTRNLFGNAEYLRIAAQGGAANAGVQDQLPKARFLDHRPGSSWRAQRSSTTRRSPITAAVGLGWLGSSDASGSDVTAGIGLQGNQGECRPGRPTPQSDDCLRSDPTLFADRSAGLP